MRKKVGNGNKGVKGKWLQSCIINKHYVHVCLFWILEMHSKPKTNKQKLLIFLSLGKKSSIVHAIYGPLIVNLSRFGLLLTAEVITLKSHNKRFSAVCLEPISKDYQEFHLLNVIENMYTYMCYD